MQIGAGTIGLAAATFLAAAVEFVEAFTIVLAVGVTRSWRSALTGAGVAVLALTTVTAVARVALIDWVSQSLLQLVIGTLLLIFGLQWLRKAILRSAGLVALHDEEEAFRAQQEAAHRAGCEVRLGLDWFAFVVAFKGVFLEGLEVVFIVITFGLAATDPNGILVAAGGAVTAGVLVLIAGVIAHRPLSAVPENTMKYAVGLLLTSFGAFWAVEGLGYFAGGESLEWPGKDAAIPGLVVAWFVLSRLAVAVLRRLREASRHPGSVDAQHPRLHMQPSGEQGRRNMSPLIGFVGFCYDFIVGEAWEIAAGIIVVLPFSALLLRTNTVGRRSVSLLTTAGIILVVGGSLLTEVRRRTRAQLL